VGERASLTGFQGKRRYRRQQALSQKKALLGRECIVLKN